MEWYWDPVHCNSELGNIVLDRVLGDASPNDFGIVLTSSNVNEVLARERVEFRAYIATHGQDHDQIAAMVLDTADWRKGIDASISLP